MEDSKKWYSSVYVWVVVVLTLVAVVTWQVTRSEVSAPGVEEPENEVVSESMSQYVGMSEEEATELADSAGIPNRVVHRDGEDQAVTMDYRADRLNFWVAEGEVYQVLRDEDMGPIEEFDN